MWSDIPLKPWCIAIPNILVDSVLLLPRFSLPVPYFTLQIFSILSGLVQKGQEQLNIF